MIDPTEAMRVRRERFDRLLFLCGRLDDAGIDDVIAYAESRQDAPFPPDPYDPLVVANRRAHAEVKKMLAAPEARVVKTKTKRR